MARIKPTLRYLTNESERLVQVPNVTELSSARYAFLQKLLNLFSEIAIGYGSRLVKTEERAYWVAHFEEHEYHTVMHWLSRIEYYVCVTDEKSLFEVPVETKDTMTGA